MDDLDKQLLSLLTKDGRMPSARLARIVGASERTVANRVNRLIRSGAISIIGVVNHEFFGYEVMADILCEAEPRSLDEIAAQVAEFPEVSYVAVSFGDRDISLQAVAKSTAQLYEFVTGKLARVPGIERTRTVIVPKVVKDFHEWLPEEITSVARRPDRVQETRHPVPEPSTTSRIADHGAQE
jgi:Lrp/AsnC family transcriptional regulator for asnA, asnC and gidA